MHAIGSRVGDCRVTPPPEPFRPTNRVLGERGMSREVLEVLAERGQFRVRAFATACGMSPRQLQRFFRASFDCTPRAFLLEERLQAARRMLASATSVKEVAYTVGFLQQSQFSRDFKSRFGVAPSEVLGAERDLSSGRVRAPEPRPH
jgi:transcriptional regulator GlxA family with amidase domain